jgi:hypothetical protein
VRALGLSSFWLVTVVVASCSGSSFTPAADPAAIGGDGTQSEVGAGGGADDPLEPVGGQGGGTDIGLGGSTSFGPVPGSAGAESGGGGTASEGGAPVTITPGGGAGGETEPSCAASLCSVNASCALVAGEPKCSCDSGFHGDGYDCRRYASCAELHTAESTLPSAAYRIQPALAEAEFEVYCDMTTKGGGWTLVLNQGTGFDPQGDGGDADACFSSNCVTRAYSTLPVVSGIMLDMRDGDISGDVFDVRAIVTAVQAGSRGKTLKSLFTNGPNFFEKEDNSNLELVSANPDYCGIDDIEGNTRNMLCGTPVLTFADHVTSCPFPDATHAIGIRKSYTEDWANCAGWPSQPNLGANWALDNVRAWVR